MGKNEDKKDAETLRGIAKLRYILFLLKPYWRYGKVYMLLNLITSIAFQPINSVLQTLLPKYAIDGVMTGQSARQIITTVALFTLGISAVAIAQMILNLFQNPAQMRVSMKIDQEISEKALRTDFKYYDNPEYFTTFTFAQQQYSNQAQMVAALLPNVLRSLTTAIAMGALISAAGPILMVITLVFVVLQTIMQFPQMKISAEYSMTFSEVQRPLGYITRALQMKENTAEMRSSGAGEKLLQNYVRVLDNFNNVYSKLIKRLYKFNIPQSIFSPVQSAIILLYIIIFVIDGDTSKIGLYASLTAASSMLAMNLSQIFSLVSNLYSSTMYGERIVKFFEAESIIEPPHDGAVPPPEGSYNVELRDVSFRYRNAEFGIESLNLKIPAGQRVAIVGENGAGKSTLTKLLLRLYDVDSGAVFINDRDIREYDVHALRRRIGIAYQDVRILAMSLRDNMTVYNDVSDEQLMEVVERLGLESVVEKVGGNLDTMVSREFTKDGAVLSGGEAQRLSLARLFTGSFGLLLLDEPSSALDPLAEHKLMQVILDASNTATTIMIAHRLSTVRDFDVIYHIADGAIIEAGTHDELMRAHGKYYEMFTRQAENYQGQYEAAE